jgi:hypothetical protein
MHTEVEQTPKSRTLEPHSDETSAHRQLFFDLLIDYKVEELMRKLSGKPLMRRFHSMRSLLHCGKEKLNTSLPADTTTYCTPSTA